MPLITLYIQEIVPDHSSLFVYSLSFFHCIVRSFSQPLSFYLYPSSTWICFFFRTTSETKYLNEKWEAFTQNILHFWKFHFSNFSVLIFVSISSRNICQNSGRKINMVLSLSLSLYFSVGLFLSTFCWFWMGKKLSKEKRYRAGEVICLWFCFMILSFTLYHLTFGFRKKWTEY